MIIFKKLLWSFLIYTGISMFFALVRYSSTSGLEESQGVFLMVIGVAAFCLLNFLLSLPALFNLDQKVKKNIYLSTLTFLGLPYLFLLYLIILFITQRSDDDSFALFLMLCCPSILCVGTLSYHFYKFRQSIATDELPLL